MKLPNEFANYWNKSARTAADEFAEGADGVQPNLTIKAYFKKNKSGGSFWLEIRNPRADIRLIDIEIQKEINPLTLRTRVWYYSGELSLARKHIELGLISLGDEEVSCSAIKPRESWERQLANDGVSVDGVEYPLRKVAFLTNPSELSAAITVILNDLWRIASRIQEGSVVAAKHLFPDEISELQARLYEGAVSKANVNRFERNRKARELCLAHFGVECSVCHIRFEDKYGEIGERFMHVHHIIELSSIGHEYSVDPIRDLVPVCPNCHAMLHQREPPLSIDELRLRLKSRP